MANGKKKKGRNLVLLCLLLVCMVGVYVFLTGQKKSEEKTEEEDSVTLTNWKSEEVNGIQYTREKESISLIKEGDKWKMKEEKEFPLNQTYASAMADTMASIESSRTVVENCENLEDYGLAEKSQPVLTITVDAVEKDSAALLLGSEVPNDGGYYAMLKGKNTVYTVPASVYSSFHYTRNQLMEMEEVPDISADSITHLAIKNQNQPDFELKYDESNVANPWTIEKGYGSAVGADLGKVTDFLANYSGISYLEGVDYKGDNTAKYGLEEPAANVLIEYNETEENAESEPEAKKIPRTVLLQIGHTDAVGNYYVKMEDSDRIYTMSSDTVQTLLTVKPFDLVDTSVMLYDINQLEELKIGYNGKVSVFTGTHETKKGEDDTEKTIHTYYLNGKETEIEKFQDLYGKITAFYVQQERTEERKELQPILTLELKRKDAREETVKTSFYPYDENYVSVEMKGQEFFLMDKRTIDDFVTALEEYQS